MTRAALVPRGVRRSLSVVRCDEPVTVPVLNSRSCWERAAVLRDKLVEVGWRLYDDLQFTEVEGADHSEGAWAARFEAVLRFLYPPPPPV